MENKYVLLSGANGGIGKSILKLLIKNNYKVISLDLSDSNIKDLNTDFIKCDITNKEEITSTYNKIKSITNNLYAIVNAVGIFKMESIIEGSEEDLRKIFDVNFFGIYLLNKAMFSLLDSDSRIINITSELARYSPQPFQAYYNLSKIALDKYTDVLRRESNYLGIKVIKVQSGSMNTPLLKTADSEFNEMANESKYFKRPLLKLKYMMEKELKKTNNPDVLAKVILKILNKKKPKIHNFNANKSF